MKKTYVTSIPDESGAFLRACRLISALGLNITRVSYNKAVDIHTLFVEVDGSDEQLTRADAELSAIGYFQSSDTDPSIVLLEFKLKDSPGSVVAILDLIARFDLNISYMSAHENGSGYQRFRMGLLIADHAALDDLVAQASKICPTRVIDYSRTERTFDNSIFYTSFVNGLAGSMGLSGDNTDELMINVNLAMQTLDEHDLSPYRTFDCISHFAEQLAKYRGENFSPRINRYDITSRTSVTVIEPPCGSNTAIIASDGKYLFVDTGYACYRDEMLALFRNLIPDFDGIEKVALITHADVDHCGLLSLFDRVYMSRRSCDSLTLEYRRENAFREQNALHSPYIKICKILTYYQPADPAHAEIICGRTDTAREPLAQAGYFDFGELHFEIYEGAGGHLPGEIVLIDYDHSIAFSGDIYVNIKGYTAEQAEYNRYAPILMTSVDTDARLASAERRALMRRLGAGDWSIFGAHGLRKEYNVKNE